MTYQKQLRPAGLTLAVGSAVMGMLLCVGCDDSHVADRTVRSTLEEARLAQLKTGGEQGAMQAQSLLEKAAGEAEAPAATKAHAKAMLAQAQFDSAINQISDPEAGVDNGNREIARLIWETGQLAQQIRSTNNLVQSYRQFEPKDARAAVAKGVADATGAADKPTWVGEGATAVPTLSAAKQEVAKFQDALAKQQDQIKQLQAQQLQAAQESDAAARQAETLTGRPALDQFRVAADLRKKAADIASQVDVANAKLAQIQDDLNLAQVRQDAVGIAVAQFEQLGKQVDEGWQNVEKQVVRQQQLATQILQGDPKSATASIANNAAKLSEHLKTTKEAYDKAEENLNAAIKNFGEASSAAGTLASDVRSKAADIPSDNPMRKALDMLVDVYNPVVFKLGEANAKLALANLQASRTDVMNERLKLVADLKGVLKDAGLTIPAELDDAALAESIKTTAASAATNYDEAAQLYLDVSQAAGVSDSDKNAGRSGRVFSLYGHALLGRATGDKSAADFLKQAMTARDEILQESKTALAALPAELVPAPTTAPATVPAATTPAAPAPATPPAEGATPAPAADPAAAPVPAAPTDGAAPAAPAPPAAPTDAATPAAPAVPAEGAAPAPAAP